MATCRICGKELKRGEKYKSPRYKNITVCSEACYDELVAQKESTPKAEPFPGYNKLFDYIKLQWGGNENVNWMLTSKQVKFFIKEYGMDCKEIKIVLKYAIEIEGKPVDIDYGIEQFIPRYVEPCRRYIEQLSKAKELAENMKEEEVVVRKVSKQMKKVKEEEWD